MPKKVEDDVELTPELSAVSRAAFKVFDRDADGTFTASDLGHVLRNLGQNPSREELTDMIKEIDVDGKGTVDFSDFLSLMARKMKSRAHQADYVDGKPFSDDDLKEAFKIFDKDHDGFISAVEFQTILKNFGEEVSEEVAAEALRAADYDKDGKVSFGDFLKYIDEHGS